MQNDIYLYSIYILIAGLVGGLLPFIKKWSDELLHLFLSFGAGIFIGTVFLHLLPEAFSHSDHSSTPLFILIGFMTIFLIERFLFIKGGDGGYDHSHLVVSITAMVGLSVHSLIEGLGLAVGYQFKDIGSLILISILAHKSTAAFALASLFLLAKLTRKKIFLMILIFAAMTPVGAILFSLSITEINHEALEPLLGLTSGTFLYVAVGELLPEVFHTDSNRWFKLILLIIGIAIMSFLGHGH